MLAVERFAAGLVALLIIAPGCGSANPESGSQVVEGAGGNAMAETDIGIVAGAVQEIQRACRRGAPAGAFMKPATVIADVTRRAPTNVYESGNSDEAVQMRKFATQLAQQLRACDATAAANVLAGAASGGA